MARPGAKVMKSPRGEAQQRLHGQKQGAQWTQEQIGGLALRCTFFY